MEILDLNISYAVIGVFSGITSGLFGIGGGMVIVPIMLTLGLSSHHAIAISVIQMIFASVFGSWLNYKKKNFYLKDGVFVGIGGLIGASFSGELVKFFSDIALTSIFLCVSIVFFIKYFFSAKDADNQAQRSELQRNMILVLAGAFTGLFAISLGIGGGLMIAPILGYFLGYNSKKVVSLSLFFVIFAAISGTFSFIREEVIDKSIVQNGILIGLGSMLGVYIGIKIIEKMKLTSHKKALLIIYVLSILMTAFSLLRKMQIINL